MKNRKKFVLTGLMAVFMLLALLPASALGAGIAFNDVNVGDWYYDAVQYVSENGLMTGVGGDKFAPADDVTRGMIVTILYRMEGSPEVSGTCPFGDVAAGIWYEKGVTWAAANGIVNGYSADAFGPDDSISREQMAAIFYRYAGYKEYDVSKKADLSVFADAEKVSDWAADAMSWCNAVGLINGVGGNTLAPEDTSTRAQLAAILMRFEKNVAGESDEPKPTPTPKPSSGGQGWRSRVEPEPTPPPATGYIVTFNSNGGSAVASQTVESGGTVAMPETPYLAGYTFAGWYTDSETSKLYDFSTPVTADFTLYAKWVVADDYSEDVSTEVLPEDEFILSASEKEIPVDSNTIVVFNVQSTLTLSDGFKLYCDGIDTGITLYDDGNYELHTDDIPNDGCYSGAYAIDVDSESDIFFTAKANVGYETIETNAVSIFVYAGLTEEQCEAIDAFEDGAAAIIANVTDANPNESKEALILAIKSEMDIYLKDAVDAGTITDLAYDANNYSYSWTYSETGFGSTLFIYDKFSSFDNSDIPEIKANGEGEGYESNITENKALNDSLTSSVSYSQGNVIILNYYERDHSWSKSYDKLGDKLRSAGFNVASVYSMECSDFKHLQKYNSMVIVDSHGNTIDAKRTGTPMICTAEKQTSEKNSNLYYTDIKKGRIERVELSDGSKVYWISPELFTFYYGDNPLKSPIVYLGCCRNYPAPEKNNQMVNALNNSGAAAVCGYSASVSVAYDNEMVSTIVEDLLAGYNVEEAIDSAKKQNGVRDPYYYDDGDDWKRRAELNYYGYGNAKIYHKLNNGNFDDTLGIALSDAVWGWDEYGDARSIFKLSGIKPKSSPKMSIISSGFGSLNGETTSCLYQTFLVPADASELEFSYDVVSEEPMEYVGTQYNDVFQVDILNTNGDILETIAYESVNTSKWYAINGIDFPGGDQTTYHTRWIDVSSDTIKKYREKLVVIRFTVQDAGDAIFDTAALIDNVAIK
ncbi:MAG: S-layer homology domain-containing protein [Firmicutes bacterium]|nr:S-layer homology domain-containing protein [Bacillota bacterium]